MRVGSLEEVSSGTPVEKAPNHCPDDVSGDSTAGSHEAVVLPSLNV